MNWHNTLKEIFQKLELSGYNKIKEDLHEGKLSGGTGGEIFSIVLTKLIDIKRHNPDVFRVIEKEIEEFIRYAKSINYLNQDFEK